MKKFIKYLIAFLLPIIILASSAEVLIRRIPNRFKLQADYLDAKANEIETLILGSSHTLYGIDPEFLSSPSFNVSNVSQTIDLDFEIIKKYNKELSNLKTVVIRLSYTTLFEKLSESNEKWRMKDYVIYLGLKTQFNFIQRSEVLSVKLRSNLQRLFEFYIQGKNTLETNRLGWGTDAAFNYKQDLEKTGVMVAKKHTIENKMFFDENYTTLNELVLYCNERNIKVVLITFPAYKSYTSRLEHNQFETMVNTGLLLERKFDHCRYYNFINNNLFSSNDFFDADHLNKNGAKKFSLLLNDLLNQ